MVYAYSGCELIVESYPDYSSALFIERGSLNQIQSSATWLVSLATLVGGSSALPSEARVMDDELPPPGIYVGFWGSKL